jgi:hypothetical protein
MPATSAWSRRRCPLLVKDSHRPVPYFVRIRTAEPARGTEPLRQRLHDSATALYLARHVEQPPLRYAA